MQVETFVRTRPLDGRHGPAGGLLPSRLRAVPVQRLQRWRAAGGRVGRPLSLI
jgi:hypothetical protein